MKTPNFILTRDGLDAKLSVVDRQDREVTVLRARFHNEEVELLDVFDTDEITDTMNADWNASYQIRLPELYASVRILQAYLNELPLYYDVEAIDPATFTQSSFQWNPAWGDAVTVETVTVPLNLGKKSIRKYIKQ